MQNYDFANFSSVLGTWYCCKNKINAYVGKTLIVFFYLNTSWFCTIELYLLIQSSSNNNNNKSLNETKQFFLFYFSFKNCLLYFIASEHQIVFVFTFNKNIKWLV